ncbi:MAG: hypothetical protein ACYSUP_11405 [Planctomycetota bacterium]
MLYRKARDWFIRTEHWRDMLDDWYCETGSAPRTYTGIDEVHNKDIANNSGFEELLAAWVAKNFCGTKLKESDFWSVDSGDFHWEYHYPDCHAGGRAAYTDATDFLGSYDAYLTVTKNEDCLLDISVTAKNKTNWKSACKTVQSIGYYCSYSNHARNAGPAHMYPVEEVILSRNMCLMLRTCPSLGSALYVRHPNRSEGLQPIDSAACQKEGLPVCKCGGW